MQIQTPQRSDLSACDPCHLRLSFSRDGPLQHAQHDDAHGSRPAAQHRILHHGHLRSHWSACQDFHRLRRCGSAAEGAHADHEASVQPPWSGISRRCDDVPFRQPGNHHAGPGQEIRQVLQEISANLPHQLRNSIRNGSDRECVHDRPGIFPRTGCRTPGSSDRLHCIHPSDAVLHLQGIPFIQGPGRSRGEPRHQ